MNFNCREIVYSIVKYSASDFDSLDMGSELRRWKDELDSNSFAKPLLVGSPFDDDSGHMDLNISMGDGPEENAVYVVLYYFYEDSEYTVSSSIDGDWEVEVEPILAEITGECAMNYLRCNDDEEYFECDTSSSPSSKFIKIYRDSEVVVDGSVDELFEGLD